MMRYRNFIFYMVIIFIGLGLFSCGNKKSEPDNHIYLDSFEYQIDRNKGTVNNEISYSLSFNINFSLKEEFIVDELVVRIAATTKAIDTKKYFQMVVDDCNTEKVTMLTTAERYPYILLSYSIDDLKYSVNARIKITTMDLIDDINHFLTIQCSCDTNEIVDENNLLDEVYFKMNYNDDSAIHYEFDEFSESYTVISYIAQQESFEIPATYKGYPVTAIDDYAFYGCSNLKSITIPDSITRIGENAFKGCSFTSITIPDSVTRIGDYAFDFCGNIEKATIPAIAIPYIGKQNLKEVVITSGTSIDANAFSACSSLTSIIIPNTIASIGDRAFWGCSSLTSIVIPDSVTSIGEDVFDGCSSIESATIPDIAISTLPKDNLKEIIITSGDKIEASFNSFTNLTKIVIPNSVTSIGYNPFGGCTRLEYNEYENGCYVGNEENPYLVFVKSKSKDITDFKVHMDTKVIVKSAFEGCYNLTSLTIPFVGAGFNGTTDTYLGYIFDLTPSDNSDNVPTSLKEVIITGGESIGDNAFSGCSNISSITISNNVTSIGDNAFSSCSSLRSVTLPSSVTSIGSNAFIYCLILNEVFYEGTIVDWCKIKFNDKYSNPMSYASQFYIRNSSNEWEVVTSIEIPSSITEIGNYQFYGLIDVICLTVPDSVTSIGVSAFQGCSSLTKITLPFVGTGLNETTNTHFGYIFGASTYSHNSAFVPSNLKEVIITGGESIGDNAFSGCSNISSITIPNSVTSIGDNAFSSCSSLRSVTLPSSVTSIGSNAFIYCLILNEVYYMGTQNEWESITINTNQNDDLISAAIYYYLETKPSDGGHYWHYVDGTITRW